MTTEIMRNFIVGYSVSQCDKKRENARKKEGRVRCGGPQGVLDLRVLANAVFHSAPQVPGSPRPLPALGPCRGRSPNSN